MTQLFIRFYVGVLVVLFLAWYIYGVVFERRTAADRARVVEEAHAGGARLVANEINRASQDERDEVVQRLREQFKYPVQVFSIRELPAVIQRQAPREDVAHMVRDPNRDVVAAALDGGKEIVQLGPFPSYRLAEIESSLGGWMRLTAEKIDAAVEGERQRVLDELQLEFDFPLELTTIDDLPEEAKNRILNGADVVFYTNNGERYFSVTPLAEGLVRFGPFPSFEQIEQQAATTTLALVLLPAAIAIALLLRPVAHQLRLVENAAKAIASGDLSARVYERRVRSAKPLAQAFNNMAGRTETLVRTQRELLQAVSHELRTPLSRMRFAIDLIETAKDDAERKQRLDSLDAAAEELDQLVGELLRYVRAETAEPRLNREQVALRDVLDVLLPKYATLHPAIEFDVSQQVTADVINVDADRLGLQRVLGNLLSNAGRFAKCRVKISSECSQGTTTIDVDDDGGGIPDPDRQRVFEPFVRLDEAANDSSRGVGLGLALVKRIVTHHGGTVEVMTSPLGGCRIRTTWPSQPAEDLPHV